MTRILESANVFNEDGHLHFSRLDGSNFLSEQRNSYLWRLYEYWINCGEFIEIDDVRFLLPHHQTFKPESALNGNEARFVTGVDMTATFAEVEPLDSAIFGRVSAIDEHTVGWCWSCANSREPLYYFMQLHDNGIIHACYRLLLPSVDDNDKVVRIDIAHYFADRNLQIVAEDAFSWA